MSCLKRPSVSPCDGLSYRDAAGRANHIKRTTVKNLGKLLAITLLVGAATAVQAQVISWNLDRFGTLTPTATAGVVVASNWNNSWPANPTVNLADGTGTPTTLDLSYGSPVGSWSIQGSDPGLDADGSSNKRLLNGYLNGGPAGWNPNPPYNFFTVTEIPYAVYDIYVYFSADVADRIGYVTDGATSFYFSTLGPAAISGGNALFMQTTETDSGNHPLANYAVFSGLSGNAQTITLQMEVNDAWGGIAGFQIVAVPEPSTFALVGLGLASLLIFRRRA